MQVDEEVKGGQAAANSNLDIGGYEDDSEDEREIKELEEKQKDILFALSDAGKATVAQVGATPATLVVCACSHSQSLAKIMYAADWQEIGIATSTKSTKDKASAEEKEPKTILTVYSFNAATPFYFAVPEDALSSDAINPVVNQIFG